MNWKPSDVFKIALIAAVGACVGIFLYGILLPLGILAFAALLVVVPLAMVLAGLSLFFGRLRARYLVRRGWAERESKA